MFFRYANRICLTGPMVKVVMCFSGTHNYTACSKDYMYHCEDEAKCVPYMFTCDGNSDCSHGSDESLSQCFGKRNSNSVQSLLTLKAPIRTAADEKFCNVFPTFRKK